MNTEERIHNLEVAIVALVSLLEDDQRPETKEAIVKMSKDFFSHAQDLGGFKSAYFK